MKKLFLIVIALVAMVGCSGEVSFDTPVEPDAWTQYEASGATGLHVYDINATAPVTVTGRVVGNSVGYTLGCGQFMSWDVSQFDSVNYALWLGEDITITYDADLFQCNTIYHCGYDGVTNTAVLNGSVWDVPVTCRVAP